MVREALAEAMNVSCSEYKIMMETQGSDRNKLYAETAMSNGGTGELDENSGCHKCCPTLISIVSHRDVLVYVGLQYLYVYVCIVSFTTGTVNWFLPHSGFCVRGVALICT